MSSLAAFRAFRSTSGRSGSSITQWRAYAPPAESKDLVLVAPLPVSTLLMTLILMRCGAAIGWASVGQTCAGQHVFVPLLLWPGKRLELL